MKRFALLALPIVLLASCSSGSANKKVGDSPFYPLKIGNTWTYKYEGGTEKLINKVVAHEAIGDQMCAKIESTVNGQVVGTEHIAVTQNGIYRYALNGKKADKPILLLKLPPTSGDEWRLDETYGKKDDVGKMTVAQESVELGSDNKKVTLKAFAVGGKFETSGQVIEAKNYFVENMGIVKSTVSVSVLTRYITIELEKFEPAP